MAQKSATPWPQKALRIMVGFPAGTSPDLLARTLAEPLSQALGHPVMVENRPGAGGNIAADLVAKATDQHTIGIMINGNLTIAKLLNPQTPFDPARDLAPISLIGLAPLVLTAPVSAPGQTVQEFFAAARQSATSWNYGTPGVGTVGHLGMELLKARTQMQAVHIPFPGYPQVVTAMIGGHIQLSMLPPALAMAQLRAGKIRALGMTSVGRSLLAPEIPSLSEAGIKNFELEIWTAAAAPASMPPANVAKLAELISEISRSAAIREKLFQQGWQVAGTTAEGLANRIKADTLTLGKIISDRSIKAE